MKTGIPQQEKTTDIWFDEKDPLIHIRTPVFLLVTYGGRAYEDTLKELKDLLEKQNFICIGAAAMAAEHAIVPQIETGRPNDNDYEELDTFLIEVKNA